MLKVLLTKFLTLVTVGLLTSLIGLAPGMVVKFLDETTSIYGINDAVAGKSKRRSSSRRSKSRSSLFSFSSRSKTRSTRKRNGTGVGTNAIVPAAVGAAAAVAIIDELPAAERPDLRLCTASKSGNYYWTGNVIARNASKVANVKLITTAGSMDNLERVFNGECDAAFVQRDAYLVFADSHPESQFDFERVFFALQ